MDGWERDRANTVQVPAETRPARVRIGVIGCSGFATRKMMAAIARTAAAELVAVASRSAHRAADVASRFGVEPVAGYENLLDRPDIEAVYLPLPSELHAQWIELSLLAGKHVLAEKPMTTRLARTEELLSLATGAGLVLSENILFPHHGQHRSVRALISDGMIGQIRSFTATFTVPPRPSDDIRYRRELGGGALLDQGVYPVSATQLLLGPGFEVAGSHLRYEGEVDVSGAALLVRPDGVTAHLSFGMEHSYLSQYEVHGSVGRIVVGHAFTPDPVTPPDISLTSGEKIKKLPLAADDQYANAVEAFCDRVRGNAVLSEQSIVDRARIIDAIRTKDVQASELLQVR